MKKILFLTPVLLLTSGCATIVEGNDQTILFNTDPSGATCSITREGQSLYSNFTTPTSLQIEKDKDYLTITCEKEGYEKKVINADSDFEGWTFGNIIFGGIIGIGVDAASGAMNEYPSQIVVPLQKK